MVLKELWRDNLVIEEKSIKRRRKMKTNSLESLLQSNISGNFNPEMSITEDRQQQIDKSVLKAWICAGIPFETIDNPFVIDMFKILNNGYNPPSQNTLSGCILDEKVAKVEKTIDIELKSEKNLTLNMYKFYFKF